MKQPTRQGDRPAAGRLILTAPLTLFVWLLRAAERLLGFFTTAFGGLASSLSYIQGRFLLFRVRPDDIFVAAYPRSGQTLTQMILYQLTTDGSMDIRHISEVSPWFERTMAKGVRDLDSFDSPRILKTHLPYRMVPKGGRRYIYVVRDGSDVAVSYYHMQRSYGRFKGSFEKFFPLYLRGRIRWGSWFRHVAQWKANRRDLPILYLSFEEMITDLEGTVSKIAKFCEISIPPTEMPRILERCSFAFMKQHEEKFEHHTERLLEQGSIRGKFIREGRAGSGAALDDEQRRRYEQEHSKWFGASEPQQTRQV